MALGISQLALSGEAPASKAATMRAYMYIKEDSDRFVGEGVAELKEFDGDSVKALAAAKERARGDLASNVRVQVSSDTAEKLESKNGKVTEELKSESKSHADVALENVKYMEFKDFPEKGQMTVLASLSKEDYRRQLAGKKVSVYLPENSLRFGAGYTVNDSTVRIARDSNRTDGLAQGGSAFSMNLDYTWESYVSHISLPNPFANPLTDLSFT